MSNEKKPITDSTTWSGPKGAALGDAVKQAAIELGVSPDIDDQWVCVELRSNGAEGHELLGLGLGRIVESEVLRLPAEFVDWYILEWRNPVQDDVHDETTLKTKASYLKEWAESGSFGDMYMDWMFEAYKAGRSRHVGTAKAGHHSSPRG